MNFNEKEIEQVVNILKIDANNIVENLFKDIVLLKKNGQNEQVFINIASSLHKLKSLLGAVNFSKQQYLVHCLESVLPVLSNNVDCFLKILDVLEYSIRFINNNLTSLTELTEIITDSELYQDLIKIAENVSNNNFDENGIDAICQRAFSTSYIAINDSKKITFDVIYKIFSEYIKRTAQKVNKDVNFNFDYEEDSQILIMINSLKEVIFNLINNSIVHGIEFPDERVILNKSKVANIYLSIQKNNDVILINFIDDGKGFDVDAIKKLAIEKELLNEEDVEFKTDEDILDLVFLPKFSTQKEVSMQAGRGIGLSSVKSEIESRKGNLRIFSRKNQGSCIKMEIPLHT